MKALILNSGLGSRMGDLTSTHPKCMTEILYGETILSRQLKEMVEIGISEVVITTGAFAEVLKDYVKSLDLNLDITFVHNDIYSKTNYIYSIYQAREYLKDDILLMHGDLVFENAVIDEIITKEDSCVVVSSTLELPQKDFKGRIIDGHINAVGIDIFDSAMALQPLYKLNKEDWLVWLDEIINFCERNEVSCYAENAFNQVSDKCKIIPFDVENRLCAEIDTPEDLKVVSNRLKDIVNKTVYMSFSADMIHGGHIKIIKRAQRLGKLIIGVLSDEAVASYKRFPLMPFEERKTNLENIKGVYKVVEQDTLSYESALKKYKPDYVVHGDDWVSGIQKPIRDEVVNVLVSYGGKLVEFPYSSDKKYQELDKRAKAELSQPDSRRGRLSKLIGMKGLVTAMEAHNGLTGLIVENTVVNENGGTHQFDAMWVSSLCDSTAKGKPDIELVDMTSRLKTIDEIMEVTTKPIIFDGDTGGLTEHFVYTVRTLERMGVSMVIIEDKTGLKKNSLFGNEVTQIQEDIERFCEKIRAGKKAQKTKDFMICARIESLILDKGEDDAINRAKVYVEAGADAIMIHSRKKNPAEILSFVKRFRACDSSTPIVVVPTSFNEVTEEEFKEAGVNIVIYANQFTRSAFPAMMNAAMSILKHHRAKECDDICMSFKDIISLIPEEEL